MERAQPISRELKAKSTEDQEAKKTLNKSQMTTKIFSL